MDGLARALAYLEKLPPSISGSDGSRATMRAARACRRLGLSEGDMWQALSWYNENRCSPPWSEKELRHKVASVMKTETTKPLARGYGRRQPPAPVRADALKNRMVARRQQGESRRQVLAAAATADILAELEARGEIEPGGWYQGEPPEAPPPYDDGPTAEYWGWPPLPAKVDHGVPNA